MADTSDAAKSGNSASAPAGGTPAAAAPAAARLAIVSQYIRDLSFENPRGSGVGQTAAGRPEIQVQVDVRAKKVGEAAEAADQAGDRSKEVLEPTAGAGDAAKDTGGGVYEIELQMDVNAKSGDTQIFMLELVYGGVFNLSNIPANTLQALLLIECPRLLFPFARRIVADVTRDGGFPPLMIDPIDFVSLYRRRLQAQQAKQASSDPGSSSTSPVG